MCKRPDPTTLNPRLEGFDSFKAMAQSGSRKPCPWPEGSEEHKEWVKGSSNALHGLPWNFD